MKLDSSPKLVAEYILKLAQNENNPLTPMQVLKLVYIAHGWQLGLFGRPLVNESIEAWPYGPVIPSVYHEYKRYGSRFINAVPAELPTGFDQSEANTLAQVFKGYGKRSGISLSSLTHEPGTPWSVTVKQSGIGSVISNDLIGRLLSAVSDEMSLTDGIVKPEGEPEPSQRAELEAVGIADGTLRRTEQIRAHIHYGGLIAFWILVVVGSSLTPDLGLAFGCARKVSFPKFRATQ